MGRAVHGCMHECGGRVHVARAHVQLPLGVGVCSVARGTWDALKITADAVNLAIWVGASLPVALQQAAMRCMDSSEARHLRTE